MAVDNVHVVESVELCSCTSKDGRQLHYTQHRELRSSTKVDNSAFFSQAILAVCFRGFIANTDNENHLAIPLLCYCIVPVPDSVNDVEQAFIHLATTKPVVLMRTCTEGCSYS